MPLSANYHLWVLVQCARARSHFSAARKRNHSKMLEWLMQNIAQTKKKRINKLKKETTERESHSTKKKLYEALYPLQVV